MNKSLKIVTITQYIGGAFFVLCGLFLSIVTLITGFIIAALGVLLIYTAYNNRYKLIITDSLSDKIINKTVKTFAIGENSEYVKTAKILVSKKITDKKSFWKKSVSSMLFITDRRMIIVQPTIIGAKTLEFWLRDILQCTITNLGGSPSVVARTPKKIIAVNAEFGEIAKDIENEILKLTKPKAVVADINLSAQIKRYGSSVEKYTAGDFIVNYESVSREGVLMLKSPNTFIAVDVETTGLSPRSDEIIQIGAIKYENGVECDRFMSYIKPTVPISPQASKVNHIYADTVADAPSVHTVLEKFVKFIGDNTLIAHNAPFDMKFLQTSLNKCRMDTLKNSVFDTLDAARFFLTLDNYKLETISKHYGIDVTHHEAVSDCSVCARLYLDFLDNITPKYDDITDEIYHCFLVGHFEEKEAVREKMDNICKSNGGRCYKTKAKSTKFAIIVSKCYEVSYTVNGYRDDGYKVTNLENAMEYMTINL